MNSGWENVKLGEVSKMQYGYTATANSEDIGPKFLRITDIVPDIIDWSNVPYCKISEADYEKYKLRKGDIVIARTGATAGFAKLIRHDKHSVFASYLIRLRLVENCSSEFLGRLIESDIFKSFVDKVKGGAAQPQANAPLLKEFMFHLPPLPTQCKIAGVLSAYDDLIENNTRRIAILEEMAQRIYKEWFVGFKYPGHENDKLVESELGPIPEGWEVKKLGDVFTFFRGRNLTKKQMIAGDIPVVSAGINPSGFHNESNVIGPVVTVSASGANAGHISFYLRDIWASDCSYFNSEKTEHFYFCYSTVNSKKREIDNLQRGSAQPHVYPKDLMELLIANPPNNLKDKFNEMSNSNFRHIGILRKKNIILRQTRDLLLPKLISGKVDVSGLGIRN